MLGFDRKIQQPEEFAEKECMLISYRMLGLKHCYVIYYVGNKAHSSVIEPLFAFSHNQAEKLSSSIVGDPQSFLLIHHGNLIRKRDGWHSHIFVVKNRWQKALVYLTLFVKNITLVLLPTFCHNWLSLTKMKSKPKNK